MEKLKKKPEELKSPLDLWRLMGGGSKKVTTPNSKIKDSLLAVYHNRITYTFILGREVASIHFDQEKGEIFYKGHNIRNIKVTKEQKEALKEFRKVLLEDERGRPFLTPYEATLGTILAENK